MSATDFGLDPKQIAKRLAEVDKIIDGMIANVKAIDKTEARKLACSYLLLAGITRATLAGKIYCPNHLTEARTLHLSCGCDVHELEKLIASRLGLPKIPGWD